MSINNIFRKSIIVFIILFTLESCGGSYSKKNYNGTSESELEYYKKILQASPFNIEFTNSRGQSNDTTFFLKGKTQDNSASATIHYDPRDEKFYFIEFSLNKIALNPSESDINILLTFTNNFDYGFSKYFQRNFNGIFKNENNYIDNKKYINFEKGFVFAIDGDVALNNMELIKHPQKREDIISIGNYVAISIINIKKPSWLFHDFNSWKFVDK